jgi:hypothetical protein
MKQDDILAKLIENLATILEEDRPENPEIFYADEQQCAKWDKQLWDDYPALRGRVEEWCCTPGWYWHDRANPDLREGPFDSFEECERSLAEAQLTPANQ